MIEKLTSEQEQQLTIYRDKWMQIGLATGAADRAKAEDAVRRAYKIAGHEPPAQIVWSTSPLAGSIVIYILKNDETMKKIYADFQQHTKLAVDKKIEIGASVRASVRDSVGASVWASVRDSVGASVWDSVGASVRASVWDSVRDSVGDSVRDSVWDSVGDSVWDSVGDSVWDSVRASVWDSVWASVGDSVRASVGASVWDSVGDSVYHAGYGSHDANWLGFYQYFLEVLKIQACEKLIPLMDFAKEGGWFYPYKNICVISERPTAINLKPNARGVQVIHCDGGPAVAYADGFSVYALNGIRVPEWVALTKSEDFTREMITKEQNADTRREIVRKIGNRRLLEILNADILNAQDEYEVISFDIGDGRKRPFIKMICPSTGLTHVLGARPEMATVDVAMAFNFKQSKYKRPIKEDGLVHAGAFNDFEIGQTVGRHGDVLLKKTDIPIAKDAVLLRAGILHAGNNHNHEIVGAYYLREESDEKFLGILDSIALKHDEHSRHGDQTWNAGETNGTELKVDVAQEYDHWLEESRQVLD